MFTCRLPDVDLGVVEDDESDPSDRNQVEDNVAENRPAHDFEWFSNDHGGDYHCCYEYSRA